LRILLDMHIHILCLMYDRRLPKAADGKIIDKNKGTFVSAASIREVSIKAALGDTRIDPAEFIGSIHASVRGLNRLSNNLYP
jgi:PIN domain nuclease of toxin-antitoxin system